jgi:hypothetical protein
MEIVSCRQLCKIKEKVANLKCPDCFSAEFNTCEEENESKAECRSCGCIFKIGPGFPEDGME